jgi:hypothetical protein
MDHPRELLEFLRRHDDRVRMVTLGLRLTVLDEMAPCHEYIYSMRHAVVMLFGPTSRVLEDCVCMIVVFRNHVNLTFPEGAELDDPDGVLKGTGKRMRHITLKQPADVNRPEVRAYVRRARAHAGLTKRGGRQSADVITVVKSKPADTRAPLGDAPRVAPRRRKTPLKSSRDGGRRRL